MLPDIKVYKINYDFIIKNYLDKSLWHKSWNLFIYKNMTFSLSLHRIDIYDDSICFEIKLSIPGESSDTQCIYWYLNQENLTVFEKNINGAIFSLIENYEKKLIRRTEEYERYSNLYNIEDDRLRDIANNFLDENNVYNENIRDAYISDFIDNNNKVYIMRENYVSGMTYTIIPDAYLTFTEITKDVVRKNKVLNKLGNNSVLKNVQAELTELEYNIENEEYYEDAIDNLENI